MMEWIVPAEPGATDALMKVLHYARARPWYGIFFPRPLPRSMANEDEERASEAPGSMRATSFPGDGHEYVFSRIVIIMTARLCGG